VATPQRQVSLRSSDFAARRFFYYPPAHCSGGQRSSLIAFQRTARQQPMAIPTRHPEKLDQPLAATNSFDWYTWNRLSLPIESNLHRGSGGTKAAYFAEVQAKRNHFWAAGMIRQSKIAWQCDGLLAKFFVRLFLLLQDLSRLFQLLLCFLRFLAKLFVPQPKFADFISQALRTRPLSVPTPEQISRDFKPR